MAEPFQMYMQDVTVYLWSKISSNNFQQLYQTNLLTVTNLPTVLLVVNSQLYWFTYIFDFVFELSTRKFSKAPGKRLKCY